MNSKLFVKYIQFLDEEADRYIGNGGITKSQLSIFQGEIDIFKKKVDRSDFSTELKEKVDALHIDAESEDGDGSIWHYVKTFFSHFAKSSLGPIFIDDHQYEEEVVCSFVMFKNQLEEILEFHDRMKG